MKKILIIIVLFFTSCSSEITRTNFDFSEDMSLNEFKKKLQQYATENPFPNIDN
tara:strand:+ start:349 stop:510 length:162 start_codon:yes stop_codon:yes gene_type:complete